MLVPELNIDMNKETNTTNHPSHNNISDTVVKMLKIKSLLVIN